MTRLPPDEIKRMKELAEVIGNSMYIDDYLEVVISNDGYDALLDLLEVIGRLDA